jgi:hypothetical protein
LLFGNYFTLPLRAECGIYHSFKVKGVQATKANNYYENVIHAISALLMPDTTKLFGYPVILDSLPYWITGFHS